MADCGPAEVLERLRCAIGQRDLEALAACFEPDYVSEFPAHPDRAFRGHGQMRRNWSQIFGMVPDLAAILVRSVVDGETAWAEWEWRGKRVDGAPFVMRGVTIQGVRAGRIAWARLYMEPVQAGAGAADAVRQVLTGRVIE